MSFEFEKELTNEEQKALSADDQKTYIIGLLKSRGVEDVEVEPSSFMVPTAGGVDPAASSGALPPKEERPLAATQSEKEDHSDLPPSIRGELGDLNEEEPVVPSVEVAPTEEPPVEEPPTEETPPGEEPPVVEEPPTEEEPYLTASEQTVYKTKEEAILGINEKDLTIRNRDEELRLARQESELAQEESASLRRRIEADALVEKQPTAPTTELPPELPPVPTVQELYAAYDDEDKGPLEAMKMMMPHLLQDIQPLIDMAQRLNVMKADEVLKELISLKTADIIQGFHEDHIYSAVDVKFPEFEGKWRDPKDPVGKQYARIWQEIDQSYVKKFGATLTELSERSPESVQWSIEEVLTRMEAPSKNGIDPLAAATTDQPETPTEPPLTEGADKGETDKRFTREEATKLSTEAAEIAVKAVVARNKLHGQAQSESPGAKQTHPADAKKAWTSEMIKKDPMGWAKAMKDNPNYSKATLDMLPQGRG